MVMQIYCTCVQTGKGKIWLREYVPSSNDYRVSLFDVSDIIDAEVEFGDIDGDDDLDFVLQELIKMMKMNIFLEDIWMLETNQLSFLVQMNQVMI